MRLPEAKPVVLQQVETQKDDYNTPVATGDYIILGAFDAEIWPLSGSYDRGMAGITENSTHKLFTAEMTVDIKPGLYVKDSKGDLYLIEYVEDWESPVTAILERK